jgi:hypothetical protein
MATTHTHAHTHGAPGADGDLITCSIKVLPPDQWVAAAATAVRINPANHVSTQLLRSAVSELPPPEHLALMTPKRWPASGVALTVSFIENVDPALRARILSHMNAWGTYCNARFTETPANGQVRISLLGDGYWSYLGIDILHVPANQPTMNLQNFSMATIESEFHRVVRHETGHTLGFPHEHMRSEIVARIDPVKAKAYFLASDGWNADMVTRQVLTPLDNSALIATAHADPTSIMCYWLPAQIMVDGVAVPGGTDIDAQDQAFAAGVYPKPKSLVKDAKDVKHEKVEKIEHKEKQEKVEIKEKNEHKEKIEIKEKNEHKEKIEVKEKSELIDGKQIDKLHDKLLDKHFDKQPDKLGEGPGGPGPFGGDVGAQMAGVSVGGLADRVQQLEASVAAMRSFIDASLRPDLSGGALRNE